MLHLDEEPLTDIDAARAGRPCVTACTVCDGSHHWIDDCADEGDPIQVCKHCSAWRPYPDDDEE